MNFTKAQNQWCNMHSFIRKLGTIYTKKRIDYIQQLFHKIIHFGSIEISEFMRYTSLNYIIHSESFRFLPVQRHV